MKKKYFLLVLNIAAVISIICFVLTKTIGPAGLLCRGWHIFNSSEVHMDSIKITVPKQWWVKSKELNRITLNRVPPREVDEVLLSMTLMNTNINLDSDIGSQINKICLSKKKKVRLSKEMYIDKEKATAFYCENSLNNNVQDADKESASYWFWVVPQKKLMIVAPGDKQSSLPYEKYYLEVIELMKFKENSNGV